MFPQLYLLVKKNPGSFFLAIQYPARRGKGLCPNGGTPHRLSPDQPLGKGRIGGFLGSNQRDGVCQILSDVGQDPFSQRGEDKIRGSTDNKEEKDAKENQGGPPELGTTAGLARGFRERRIEHARRVRVCRYRERLSKKLFPGFLFLRVPLGMRCRFPFREHPFHLRRSRLFLPGKGYGRFDTAIVGD